MQTVQLLSIRLENADQDYYRELPFHVPEDVYKIDVRYSYPRFVVTPWGDGGERVEEINIIDLALCAPHGEYLGCSGADREHIVLGEDYSSPGYSTIRTAPGQWTIIVGGARVCEKGVEVCYELTFTHRERVLLRGDLHTHTVGSDGYLTIDELAEQAVKNKLDYLFVTDHNNYDHNGYLRPRPDITLIPGTEWTHIKGHIGMLGRCRPFTGSFHANDLESVRRKVREAAETGALTVINHPFAPGTSFRFGIENVNCDCLELWNGPFTPFTQQCLNWWHQKLLAGARIPVVGGSDFHFEEPGRFVGSPCTWVYALSRTPTDILNALRQGHCFLTSSPAGPTCDLRYGKGEMGDVVEIYPKTVAEIHMGELRAGDLVYIFHGSETETETIEITEPLRLLRLERTPEKCGFLRVELHRAYLEGDEPRPALISNPIYFNEALPGYDVMPAQ